MNGKPWTSEENETLRKIYPSFSHSEIIKQFPNRTPLAIRKQAKKLGIKADLSKRFHDKRSYSDSEIEYLLKNYHNTSAKDLSKHLGKSVNSVYKMAQKLNIKTTDQRRYFVNDYFFSKENELSMYWLGFIAADGYIYEKEDALIICISNKDKNHLYKFHKIIGGSIKEDFKRNRITLYIRSSQIISDLFNYNITPRKSLNLTPPIITRKELIKHFIRGYIDGDGSIYKYKNTIGYNILGTYKVLSYINEYIPNSNSVRKRKDCNIFVTSITGEKAIENLSYIKSGASIFLERKWNII